MFLVRHWRNIKNQEAVAAFKGAKDYLVQNSTFAADLIGDLESSDKAIEVLVNFNESTARQNAWEGPLFDSGGKGGTVHWNASRAKEAGKASAALGLMHELGHAYQFLSEKAGAKAVLKPILGFYRLRPKVFDSDEFLDNFEETNVSAIELTVATEINGSLAKANAPAEALEPTRTRYR